ncbi:MAG: thiamine phosphate synthase [Janthinobacterium lividum]
MKISKLQFISESRHHAKLAIERGIKSIQLRVKNRPYADWKREALATQDLCRRYHATFILNDNPHLAQEIGADGVHLGKQDMPAAEARALLGLGFLIGGTATTFAEVAHLAAAGVDYISLGPFRYTTPPPEPQLVLGFAGYAEVLAQCRTVQLTVPLVGFGGITPAEVAPLLRLGLHGVAIASGIAKPPYFDRSAVWEYVRCARE